MDNESPQDHTPSPSDTDEKYGFKKLEELSSNSSNSASNEEMLAKNFIETLSFGHEESSGFRNMLINTSLYFEDIDYDPENEVQYRSYESELQMTEIMSLIQRDLSEPYSIYTYRYFIHNWPQLCFLALHQDKIVGAIVCKNGLYKNNIKRGYIAMLAVNENYRRKRIGSNLVKKAIIAMQQMEADEVSAVWFALKFQFCGSSLSIERRCDRLTTACY